MKKIYLILLLCPFFLLASPTTAQEIDYPRILGDINFIPQLHATVPYGEFSKNADFGIGFGARVEYAINSRVTTSLGIAWPSFLKKELSTFENINGNLETTRPGYQVEAKHKIFPVTLGGRYYIGRGLGNQFFIGAQVGYERNNFKIEERLADTDELQRTIADRIEFDAAFFGELGMRYKKFEVSVFGRTNEKGDNGYFGASIGKVVPFRKW